VIFAIDLNPVDDIIDGVGGLIGGAAEAAGEAVLDLVIKFTFGLIADAVASITGSIVSAMDSTTAVDLNGGFFPARHVDGTRARPVPRFHHSIPGGW